ncbi:MULTISPECIES: MFS transporter [unclassified Streptomyces]|uniref:MFS transporter n=1 Tax=unclassified Streptomyces TaxID=2593676 RepID=UPI002E15994E|nr:MFS transporter [Streptomyces sp. NBC_01207]WTA18052.1 MFS transporter [Streptomyces sp. NBC_00853]
MSEQTATQEPAQRPQPPALRENRDFRLLWAGAGISFIGSRISVIAYPMLVLAQTGSAGDAGVVAFCANLPYVLQLLAGGVIDRLDRRRLMIACDIGRLAAIGSLVAALLTGHFWLAHVAAVAFVESGLTILYRISERAAVRHLVRPEDLPRALSRNEARERAAGLLGQPVGSLLFGLVRWAPFLCTALSNVVSLFTLLVIKRKFGAERASKPSGGVKGFFTELKAGLVWAWSQPFVRVLAGLIAGTNMLFAGLSLALQYIVREGGGSDGEVGFTIGLIFALSGVGGTLGALTASWWMRKVSLPAVVIGCNVAWALLMPQVAYVRNTVALGVLFAGMGYAGALWNVAAAVYQQKATPDEMQGRLLSVATLVAYGTVPLGALAGGFLLDHFGATWTVLGLGGAMCLLALTAVASPSVRRLNMS